MNTSKGYFLVIGLGGLVLRDIVGIMQQARPNLIPLVAESLADAAEQLRRGPLVPYAFLNLAPDRFIADEMSRLLDSIGTKVILMGDEAEDAAGEAPYPILVRPYFQDDVLRLLDKPD